MGKSEDLGCDYCSGENDKAGWCGSYSDDGYIGYTACWNCNPNQIVLRDTAQMTEPVYNTHILKMDIVEYGTVDKNGEPQNWTLDGANTPNTPGILVCRDGTRRYGGYTIEELRSIADGKTSE